MLINFTLSILKTYSIAIAIIRFINTNFFTEFIYTIICCINNLPIRITSTSFFTTGLWIKFCNISIYTFPIFIFTMLTKYNIISIFINCFYIINMIRIFLRDKVFCTFCRSFGIIKTKLLSEP